MGVITTTGCTIISVLSGLVSRPKLNFPYRTIRFSCLVVPDYDDGDCCECTCQNDTDDDYRCGQWADFACIDPAAPCVDDDDITADLVENCGYVSGSSQRDTATALGSTVELLASVSTPTSMRA